ncbi:MAG: hypothetical protein JNK37_05430 [Verrucomicrobiales bacterium]|nr:hypothetical protein [Verrucomicrobiales bacterium]
MKIRFTTLVAALVLTIDLSLPVRAEDAGPWRVFYTGHSFAGAAPAWLGSLAQQGGVAGYENLGRQSLGGSRVIDHWNLADEKNIAKKTLATGTVDVLVLAPNMHMPDEGIDRFVDLARQHHPAVRIAVQASWMTWDGLGRNGITNAGRDTRPVSEIRERTMKHLDEVRAQLRAINARVGADICHLIPTGAAVVRLRERIAAGELPGYDRPSLLFHDDIGHAGLAVQHLNAYLHYAVIFRRDPRTLAGIGWPVREPEPVPGFRKILLEIAWESALAEPLSGVTDAL